jgi:hypothetical protein
LFLSRNFAYSGKEFQPQLPRIGGFGGARGNDSSSDCLLHSAEIANKIISDLGLHPTERAEGKQCRNVWEKSVKDKSNKRDAQSAMAFCGPGM